MQDLFDISGRIIAITGGLGQLGRQFTNALTARGARVVALDTSAPEDHAETDAATWALRADVTSKSSLERALEQIERRWGTPYALINNAALDAPPNAPASDTAAFEAYSLDTWRSVVEVNLTGVFLTCQVIGGAMAKAGRGSVINISSIYGILSPDQRIYEFRREDGPEFFKPIGYSATKAGLLNMTRYLATYWAPRSVRVNTLTFGGVFNHQDPRFLTGYTARVPLGRMANADEYNGAVVFLVSDASSYMTGSNMVIDGGWSAW